MYDDKGPTIGAIILSNWLEMSSVGQLQAETIGSPGSMEGHKTLKQKYYLVFKSAPPPIPTVSTNPFHLTNLICCF